MSATRFQKGQSGNPRGRPKRTPDKSASAFDIVIDRTLTVIQDGAPREVTVDEALQHKTYQSAISGNRPARREVLKMILKREKARAAKAPPSRTSYQWFIEEDPDNANPALLLLEIARYDPSYGPNDPYERLLLEPWAVEAALRRKVSKHLNRRDIDEIRRSTRDADQLKLPDPRG